MIDEFAGASRRHDRPTGLWIACVVALLLSLPAQAQTAGSLLPAPPPAAPPMMTLAEALAYANAHQPEIKQTLAQLAARQAEAKIPRAGWFPRVSMQAQWVVGTTNNTTTSFFSVPGVEVPRVSSTPVTTDTQWSPSPSALVAATASQQLYEFGRIAAQSALADALTEVARANSVTVQLDIGLRVEEAYSAVLAARHILSATQEAYRRAEALFRMAETGVRTGLRPPIDRTRSQAELAQAEVARTRAETGLTSAQAALAAVIGSPELLIDAAELAPQDRAFPGLTEALHIAEEHSPEIMAALGRLRAQESETSALSRELLPNTYLAATVWGSAGGAQAGSAEPPFGNGWLASVGNYSVGLVLSWHVLDPILITRRRASQQRQQVERAAVEVARRGVVLLVERSYVDLVAAQKTLPGLVAAVTASRANLDQAQARFKAGLGTIIDVTDAETLLVSAELNLAVGQFNVARAAAQLARSLGAAQTP